MATLVITKPKQCISCNKTMYRIPGVKPGHCSIEVWNNKKFCSKKCQGYFLSRTNIGNSNPNWKGGKPECVDCKKKLSTYKTSNAKLDRCRDCYIKNNSGINHPNWIDGLKRSKYPKEFTPKLKLKIRSRDNFTCQLCGKKEFEELMELNRALCVNHIDFDKDNCHEDNLNTLCLRCNVIINYDRDFWSKKFKK